MAIGQMPLSAAGDGQRMYCDTFTIAHLSDQDENDPVEMVNVALSSMHMILSLPTLSCHDILQSVC